MGNDTKQYVFFGLRYRESVKNETITPSDIIHISTKFNAFYISHDEQQQFKIYTPSQRNINGSKVMKEISLMEDQWLLNVRGKNIPLEEIGIPNNCENNVNNLNMITCMASKIMLCQGWTVTSSQKSVPSNFLLEIFEAEGKSKMKIMRCQTCAIVLSWKCCGTTCRQCYNNLHQMTKVNDLELNEQDAKDLSEVLK